jgi:hypothetical protein
MRGYGWAEVVLEWEWVADKKAGEMAKADVALLGAAIDCQTYLSG